MKIIYYELRFENQAAVLINKYDFDQNLIEVEKKIRSVRNFVHFSNDIITNHQFGS